jgi:hypothetical protein
MPNASSAKPRLPSNRLTLACVLLSVIALQGCATVKPRAPTIRVEPALRAKCTGPTSPMQTLGDLATFAKDQEAALRECDARRAAVVDLIDKAQPKKKRWPWGS